MKIIFMGTPEFAAVALRALVDAGHEIGYVVSQPDRPKNRGKKLQPTPVKEAAERYGLRVLQPEKIKNNPEFEALMKNYEPDLTVVAAYGKIIPEEYLDIPRYGTVNIHASLLPRHRGASPVQGAILAGDKTTGVTIMYVERDLDTGDMIAKAETETEEKSCGELMRELAELGAALLTDSMKNIKNWRSEAEPQDESLATYAGMIAKSDGEIDFSRSPEEIARIVRAFDPWPGAYTYLDGEPFKIWGAEALDKRNEAPAGTITAAGDKGMEISAGGGSLLVTVVQLPGKKRVAAADFLRGYRPLQGTRLGKQ